MKLADYLKDHHLTDADFAEKVKCNRTTVLRWRKHGRLPDAVAIDAIFKATGGSVTAADFFHQRVEVSA